jgi:dTDP-4-amino-4,6-dideoxygalactose transaminase
MQELLSLAAEREIAVIEDAAQSLGSTYSLDGTARHAGTIGRIGITSFFPTKTLGCFGDGGAVFTSDIDLADRVKVIANHGQRVKYHHEIVGVNSRLDTIQAAVLGVKIRHITDFIFRRQRTAEQYDKGLESIDGIVLPKRGSERTHVFHQYTLQATDRDGLRDCLKGKGIPTVVYYPLPLHFQPAYRHLGKGPGSYPASERLSKSVVSLPIHTEMESDQVQFVCQEIRRYYNA